MINVRPNRRGIALILVTMVIALAAVMGLAMLSSTMLQQRVANNTDRAARADGMAESGINLALYYLVNPSKIPGGGTYWAGTGGADVAFGSISGTANVSVTPSGTDGRTYDITSIGKSGSAGDVISRTIYAKVRSNKYVVRQAAVFNQLVTLPVNTTITGDVATNGKLTLSNATISPAAAASVVYGAGYCTSFTLNPKPRDGFKALWTSSTLIPSTTDVFTYHPYTYNGVSYAGESLSSSTLSTSKAATPGVNPLGVFYRNSGGTFAITDNVTIDGTLVVEGNLSFQGTNITITSRENMPALVVTGYIEVQQPVGTPPRTITINGVCYVGSQLRGTGSAYTPVNTQFKVNGAILIAGSTPFAATYKASSVFKLDTTKLRADDLNTKITTPVSVSVLRWGPDKSGG